MGGPNQSDPIHQPLLDDYRRKQGLPPDGSGGPTDAQLKYGGLLYNSTRLNVSLNVVLLDNVTNTTDRDVMRANAIFQKANLGFTVVSRTVLSPKETKAILGANGKLDINPTQSGGIGTPSAEEKRLVEANFWPDKINVYYVPSLLGRDEAGYHMDGLRMDPLIVINQLVNAGATVFGALEHELGHALGLHDRGEASRLMFSGPRTGSALVQWEIDVIRSSPYAINTP